MQKLKGKVFLIGMMGSGKSRLGAWLASHHQVEHIDMDTLIELREGQTIPELFAMGESRFRAAEYRALKSLAQIDKAVVSTGGGLPCFGQNIGIIKSQGLVVFLRVERDILLERLVKSRTPRPMLGKSPEQIAQKLDQLLNKRRSCYERAHMIVPINSQSFGRNCVALDEAIMRWDDQNS